MEKHCSIALLVMIITSISSCYATQPHYQGYIIDFNNPCKDTMEYHLIFNKDRQYHYTAKHAEKGVFLDLFMKQELLDKLNKNFTVKISSNKKTHKYTPKQVNGYFYITKLSDADIWVVDAGELCGKDLLEQKQKHTKVIIN